MLSEKIKDKYDTIFKFKGELALVATKNGLHGMINKEGKEIVPCKYDWVYTFQENLAVVKLNDKYGFINEKGEEVVPCIYDNVCDFYKGLAVVRLDDKYGFVNKKGKEVIPCKYDDIQFLKKGLLAKLRLNGKWGYISINDSTQFNEFMNKIINIGSRLDTLYYQRYKDTYILSTGCFIGNLKEFEETVKWRHYENTKPYIDYMKIINDLKKELI